MLTQVTHLPGGEGINQAPSTIMGGRGGGTGMFPWGDGASVPSANRSMVEGPVTII